MRALLHGQMMECDSCVEPSGNVMMNIKRFVVKFYGAGVFNAELKATLSETCFMRFLKTPRKKKNTSTTSSRVGDIFRIAGRLQNTFEVDISSRRCDRN